MKVKINARLERLRNISLDFFNAVDIRLDYNSIASTFSFACYFNPDNPDHQELFHPLHVHLATIEHNKETLITGYMLAQDMKSGPQKELQVLGGYSLPGPLGDCQIPTAKNYDASFFDRVVGQVEQVFNLNFQSDNISLKQIAEKMINPFGLKMVIDPAVAERMNKPFEKVTADEKQTVQAYLNELAKQRNILMTHDEYGRLVFTEAKKKKPILDLTGSNIPGIKMHLSTNAQPMHSHIHVVGEPDLLGDGNAKDSDILQNPYIKYVFRPRVAVQSSGDDNDTNLTARMLLSEELKNIRLKITVDRWEIDGKIIRPNNYITVQNPEIFLYQKSEWFIESVQLQGNEKQQSATLNCVLPEVYNGQPPKYIFNHA